VGEPKWTHNEHMITTSRRQGQDREGLSEGSRSAKVRGDGQKPHSEGPACGASWHMTTKPSGSGGRVNAALAHGKFTFLLGEICAPCGVVLMAKRPGWGRTRNHLARDRAARSRGERSGSNPSGPVARPAVMHGVRAQKSAAAKLVFRPFTRVAEHEGPNMWSRAER
jgi:hypothetical protein